MTTPTANPSPTNRSKEGTLKPPVNSKRQIAILNTQNKINGCIKWSINNISLGSGVYKLELNSTVDVILQNANALAEAHLHMGMGVVFAEGVEFVKQIPKEALACGMTVRMVKM
uniref:Uncharacterized protein n=1 Tax=Ananas comosus var. bracteatus TaxID=296719 RepID=A0A6V7QRP8_ANACO